MRRNTRAALLASLALAGAAAAQHSGDIWVGRTADMQLAVGGAALGAFDTERGVAAPMSNVLNTWRSLDPGFEANINGGGDLIPLSGDPLGGSASIRLVALSSLDAEYRMEYNGNIIRNAGDFVILGDNTLHTHARHIIDRAHAGYDPLQTTWVGVYQLVDANSAATGYLPSAPFNIRVAPVACLRGDADGSGAVNFDDIDGFITVLIDPAGATAAQRCAADANLDGFVNFDDIDAFILKLIQG